MTTVETLRAARIRIEKGWCQGALAKAADGRTVMPDDPSAVSWCVFGATWGGAELSPADHAVVAAHGDSFVADWQDEPERTREEVIALLDKAIALEESK